jgi:hypothetical protein
MQELKQKILDFVKENGPVLPVQISKEINGNTIFAGAFLSELVSSNLVKMSHAKIGGSRLYYVPGQEEKLQKLVDHLSERPKKALMLLKENKVLRDKDCEPWERVALGEIKDFAVPLQVNIKGNVEIFWKWYLLTDSEAEQIILPMIKSELGVEHKQEAVDELEDEKQNADQLSNETEGLDNPLEESNEEKVSEIKEESGGQPVESFEEPNSDETVQVDEPVKEVKETEEQQVTLPTEFEKLDAGQFYDLVVDYFLGNNVKILEQNVVAKNRELNFVVQIPSSLGHLKYFVVARKKKKLSDADLTLAFHQASELKLPAMVVSTGTITKKAEKFINEKLKGLVFKQLQ